MQGSAWYVAVMNYSASLVLTVVLSCSEIINVDARQTISKTIFEDRRRGIRLFALDGLNVEH